GDRCEGRDRQAADQVADGEVEVARERGGGGDRDLRQAARDREEDQAAELVAESETDVERVGRLREEDPGSPRRGARCDENGDEERRVEPAHRPTLEEGRPCGRPGMSWQALYCG